MKAFTLIIALCLSATAAFAQNNQGQDNDRQVLVPVNQSAYGNTYGEWSARWVQWSLSIPDAKNPGTHVSPENCGSGQSGPVWFLTGPILGGIATVVCTVPAGKAIFLPVVDFIFGDGAGDCGDTNPGVLCNLADLRQLAAGSADMITNPAATVDGRPLTQLINQRVQSPVMTLTYPNGAVLELPPGTFSPNVADGYWLMIFPLSPGTHTIKVSASGVVPIQVTYQLTIR